MDTKEKFLSGVFNWIKIENTHRDLIFICGSRTLRYHQAIVAPHSKLLSELVQSTSCCGCKLQACPNDGDVVITLDDVDPDILEVLIKCVYTGSCDNVPGYMLEDVDSLQELLGLNVDLDLLEKIEDADNVESPNSAQFQGDLNGIGYDFKEEFQQESNHRSLEADQEGVLDEEYEMEEVLTEANDDGESLEIGDNSENTDSNYNQSDKEYNSEEEDDDGNEVDETGMTEEEQVAYAMQLSMADLSKDGLHKEKDGDNEDDMVSDSDEALLVDSDETVNHSDLIKENTLDSNVIEQVPETTCNESLEGGIKSIIKKEYEFETANEFEIEMVPILIKRSYVWKHFGFFKSGDGIDSKKIVCTICKVKMSYKKNTKRMSWHLENVHNIIEDVIMEDALGERTIKSDPDENNVKDESDIKVSDVNMPTVKKEPLEIGIDKSSNQSINRVMPVEPIKKDAGTEEVLSEENEETVETLSDQTIFHPMPCDVNLQRIPSEITRRLLSYATNKTSNVPETSKTEDIIVVDNRNNQESIVIDDKEDEKSIVNQNKQSTITQEANKPVNISVNKEKLNNHKPSQNDIAANKSENVKKFNDVPGQTSEISKKINDNEYDDYVSSRLRKLNSIKYSVSEISEKGVSQKNTFNAQSGKRKSDQQIQHQPVKKSLSNDDNDIQILTNTPTRNYNLRQSQESRTAQLQQTKMGGVKPRNSNLGTALLPTKISASVSLTTKNPPKKEPQLHQTKLVPSKATIVPQILQPNKDNPQPQEIKQQQTKMAIIAPMRATSVNTETDLAKNISMQQEIQSQPQTKTITNMRDPQLRQQMQIQAAKNSEMTSARANQLRQSIQTQQFKNPTHHQINQMKTGNHCQPIKSSPTEPSDYQKKLAQAKITEKIQQLTPKPSAKITRRPNSRSMSQILKPPKVIEKSAQIVRSPSQPQKQKPSSMSVKQVPGATVTPRSVSRTGNTSTLGSVAKPGASPGNERPGGSLRSVSRPGASYIPGIDPPKQQGIPQPSRRFSIPNSLQIRSSASSKK